MGRIFLRTNVVLVHFRNIRAEPAHIGSLMLVDVAFIRSAAVIFHLPEPLGQEHSDTEPRQERDLIGELRAALYAKRTVSGNSVNHVHVRERLMNAPPEGLPQRYLRAVFRFRRGYAVVTRRVVVKVRPVPVAAHSIVIHRRAEEVEL